jgi:hypothetical protein
VPPDRRSGGPPGPPPASPTDSAAAKRPKPVTSLTEPGGLAADVAALIQRTAESHPRALQVEIGPSETGDPCTRKLAYKILDWHRPRRDLDPWAAVQGVAVHAWLADAFRAENQRLGRGRYLVEQRVQPVSDDDARRLGVPGALAGSCDLFDRDTGTVTDWKLTSPGRLRTYVTGGPGPKFRAQAHLYGRGLVNAGETVLDVSIVFLPRAVTLGGIHVWSEPYDQAVADAALKRLAAIRDALIALDPERNPGRWGLFPTAPGSCRHCPWLKPGSRYLAGGCPGHLDGVAPASPVESLIA